MVGWWLPSWWRGGGSPLVAWKLKAALPAHLLGFHLSPRTAYHCPYFLLAPVDMWTLHCRCRPSVGRPHAEVYCSGARPRRAGTLANADVEATVERARVRARLRPRLMEIAN